MLYDYIITHSLWLNNAKWFLQKDYSSQSLNNFCSLVGNELNLLKILIKWIHQKIVITEGKVRIMVGKTRMEKIVKKHTVLIVYTV